MQRECADEAYWSLARLLKLEIETPDLRVSWGGRSDLFHYLWVFFCFCVDRVVCQDILGISRACLCLSSACVSCACTVCVCRVRGYEGLYLRM